MNYKNALQAVSKLNEFKNSNKEFTLKELKDYMRSIKMKGVTGITVDLLKTSNICVKQNKKLVWCNNDPINYLQLEHVITNSLNYSKQIARNYRTRCQNKIIENAEVIAFSKKTSFWSKIKNFFKKLR
jgi:hypothetical protein